jgi:hypothetical protein
MNPYSNEKERREVEAFRNIERQAAYELRQAGHVQPIVWRQK